MHNEWAFWSPSGVTTSCLSFGFTAHHPPPTIHLACQKTAPTPHHPIERTQSLLHNHLSAAHHPRTKMTHWTYSHGFSACSALSSWLSSILPNPFNILEEIFCPTIDLLAIPHFKPYLHFRYDGEEVYFASDTFALSDQCFVAHFSFQSEQAEPPSKKCKKSAMDRETLTTFIDENTEFLKKFFTPT